MTNACNPFLQRHSRAKSQKLFLIFWCNSLASICIHCWHRCIVDTDVFFQKQTDFPKHIVSVPVQLFNQNSIKLASE